MSDLSNSLKAYMKSIREVEKAEKEYEWGHEWGHEREYDEMRRAENVFLDELIEAIAERKRDRG